MNKKPLFFRLGYFIYHHRIAIVIAWILIALAGLPVIPRIFTPFKSTGLVDNSVPSAKTDAYLNQTFYYNQQRLVIMYHSDSLSTDKPAFLKAINASLTNLKKSTIPLTVYYPKKGNQQFAKDKHTAYVIIAFKIKTALTKAQLTAIQALIKKPANMTLVWGGEPIFIQSINQQTQADLYKTDMIAAPVSLVALLLIFGSVVAAIIPILLGGICAVLMLVTLYVLAQSLLLSVFTINIALLLGLCLSLDYALFINSRFREELRNPIPLSTVIALTMASAGKAVFFSGLAVFVSLSALLFFPVTLLFSMGVGGLVAVFIAVLSATTLLPAILSIVGLRIDALAIRPIARTGRPAGSFWRWLARRVVAHPVCYMIAVLSVLLMLGYPFLHVRLGVADYHVLPKQADGRAFFTMYHDKFNDHALTPITLLVTTSSGSILSRSNLNKLDDVVQTVQANPLVARVNSIVSTPHQLTPSRYYALYHQATGVQNKAVETLLMTTTNRHSTIMSVVSRYGPNMAETKTLIRQLQAMPLPNGFSMQLTGIPVTQLALLAHIPQLFPYALAWIMVLTYIILLILLRSIFLPLKAILMNIISLSASYGVLVFIFQEGHFHTWMNFEPQGMLDLSLLIIIFCALFGFSMDYEVFLLSRIKEGYERYHDTKKSIVVGIDKSARIITSAAMIVIILCGSFMFADVLMVKEFGLGIAVAVFVDAFLVRSLLVPSTMVLLKQWNWYCPRWINRFFLPHSPE